MRLKDIIYNPGLKETSYPENKKESEEQGRYKHYNPKFRGCKEGIYLFPQTFFRLEP